ncbi:MAG: hypothetical protein ACJ8JD_03965 [Chthoniobacterales bacterium]
MFGTVAAMFRAGCIVVLLIASTAFAQEQESKLVDRLLKPDMTLANSAQDKQFIAVRHATAKSVSAHEFGGVHEMPLKEYGGQRAFFAWLFGRTRDFPRPHSAVLASRSEVPQKTFTTQETAVRESNDAQKSVTADDYAGNRPFVAQGRSQKSLDAKRHQMSIDEVRDLLNRNK